jgi:CDP-diacylglycerol--glycerol-3-phosphate 3-phosphatidyltransferase
LTDSVLDRVVDAAVGLGLAWWALSVSYDWVAGLLVAGVVGAMLASYTRARAEALGEGGPAAGGRAERVVATAIVLVLLAVWPALFPEVAVLMFAWSWWAAAARFKHAWDTLDDR